MTIKLRSGNTYGPATPPDQTGRPHDQPAEERGPSSDSQNAGVLSGLRRLPPETLQQVARHAAPADRIALGLTDRATHSRIAPDVYAATIITQDAPRVTTNAGFNALLQRIQGLSPRLQGEPLLAVLARATAVNDTPAAVNAFTPVAQNFLNSGHSFPVSSRMVQVLLADGPAGAAVRAGGNVQAIAQQYGITNDVPLGRLQNTSVNGPAGAAVMAGGNVQAIAQQYGITNDVPLGRLQNIAARANH